MDIKTIQQILVGSSKDMLALQKNIRLINDFLTLIEQLDALPQINSRLQEENRNFYSLYKAVGEDIPPRVVEKHLMGFFGAPVKSSGAAPSMKLRFYPSLKLMGKILPEQTFFVRKLNKGEFFAAVWPWVRKPGFLTIHMGYYSKTLSDTDFQKLEDLVKTCTHEKILKEMESGIGMGGQIRGINLATFLQMSEQERSTCTLSITAKNKTGRLYMENGELVDGQTEMLKGKDAVYEIIKWDNVIIEIETYSLKRKNVINTPLLNILLEGLKRKDEDTETRALETLVPDDPHPQTEVQDALVQKPQKKPPEKKNDQPARDGYDADELVIYDDLNKKPLMRYALIALLIFAVVGAGVWGTGMWRSARDIKKQYDQAMAAVNQAPDMDEKEKILDNFILNFPKSFYAESAQKKRSEISTLKDDALYAEILAKIKQLPVTHDFNGKAKAIYEQYLNRFPDGKNVTVVRQHMADLTGVVEEAQYQQLLTTHFDSKDKKVEAYKNHLLYHPNGKYREEVELFLVLETEERYETIKKKLEICDRQNEWSTCLYLCNSFIELFGNAYRTNEVKNIRDAVFIKQHLMQLRQLADKLEPDHAAIKTLYADYLARNPNFPDKQAIQNEIDKRRKLIDQAQSWQSLLAYVKNPAKSFIEKIQELDTYIDKDPTGPYAHVAREVREKIRQERLEHDRQKRLETERLQKEAARRSEAAKKQQQNQRINQEVLRVQKKLYPYQNVFEYYGNGTFKDKRTGLTWCILDSSVVLGKCLNYEEALQYVSGLNAGGRTNWRLPTFSELAGLYKSEPYFPVDGPRWFWTMERVVKGYHEMVGIVTSQQESVFNRDYVSTKECGTVHAVSP